LLTENEVSRSWQRLFAGGGEFSKETFAKAETLLDELRPESPLYHRLSAELTEIRKLKSDEGKQRKKRAKVEA
jgi:hypothetical protein